MATINEIKQQAATIKGATQVGENTADRVGGAIEGLADIAQQQEDKLSDLDDKLSTLSVSDIKNGIKKTALDANDLVKNTNDSLTVNNNSSFTFKGNSSKWSSSKSIKVLDNKLHLNFTSKSETEENNAVIVWITDNTSSYVDGKCVANEYPLGSTSIDFDIAELVAHKGFSGSNVAIWFQAKADSTITIDDLDCYFLIGGSNAEGRTLDKVIDNLAGKIDETTAVVKSININDFFLISPSGSKFTLNIDNDGNIHGVRNIPNKIAFYGNSLIGDEDIEKGVGLSASDHQHDYVYLITEKIKEKNPNLEWERYQFYDFEALADLSSADSIINTGVNRMDGKEDMVVIQLGDNVNSQAKQKLFQEYTCSKLLEEVRKKCKNARVIWMGSWYNSSFINSVVPKICKEKGVKFISWANIAFTEGTTSYYGALRNVGLQDREMPNVSKVEETNEKTIKVTFTANDGNEYTTKEFEINSYSLDGNVLKWNSIYEIVYQGGIASHPGDKGFELISKAFFNALDIVR